MSMSRYPSIVSLPQVNPGTGGVLEYLVARFPAIGPEVWRQRMAAGKVHWHDGTRITPDSPFVPQQRVCYYREVEAEPCIPFAEQVLFEDEQILVAYKPHFLPLMPGGRYVNECLQNRLRRKTGHDALQAVHRLDRATAGLVLFAVNPATRHLYHHLFESRQIEKTYQAVARVKPGEELLGQSWVVKNRLVKSEPRFLMTIAGGEPNSHSLVRCLAQAGRRALFELKPITGKTHQLRVHMQTLGWPILNDRYYPELQPESGDDYARPLQLLAKALRFIDPVTQQPRAFSTDRGLMLE
ncbi:MAG: pseudouridine synthase [Gammaproteobacteria bacterium]|nr:pseudouridine synthase [Gammaproteobacteria bacterium]